VIRISEKIPSKLELVPGFSLSLIDKISSLPLKEEEFFNIKLCLDEALVNAIKHGNKLNPDLPVEVDIEADDNSITLKVKDQGAGFDFQNIPEPIRPDTIHKVSGRGIFLIKSLMDEVEFFDYGKVIKMVKLIRKGGRR